MRPLIRSAFSQQAYQGVTDSSYPELRGPPEIKLWDLLRDVGYLANQAARAIKRAVPSLPPPSPLHRVYNDRGHIRGYIDYERNCPVNDCHGALKVCGKLQQIILNGNKVRQSC